MARILLADDDAATRDLVRRALRRTAIACTSRRTAARRSTVSAPTWRRIDVLVTDVDMPQLDGISLAEKALHMKPAIAVVLMSGFSDQLDRAGRLRVRKLLSVSKPFTLEQIKQVVRTVLA